MSELHKIISELATIEYKLFVVNTHAVALQGQDGKYYTKYFSISPIVLKSMIENHGSLGCYQQVFKSGHIRWICLDFDCKVGSKVDVKALYANCIVPVTDYLDSRGINYLLEFSGRRGIHIWIVLDKLIKKSLGFRMLNAILNAVPHIRNFLNEGDVGLDRFPSTDIDINNKVGLQVKFPLSWHKKGTRSFFFRKSSSFLYQSFIDLSISAEIDYFDSADFFYEQLEILREYIPEDKESLCLKLGIFDDDSDQTMLFTRYSLINNCTATLNDIVSALSKTAVYHNIFSRMQRGQALHYDWLVILGTFSCFASCEDILTSLFSQYPNYDVKLTIDNIKKFKNRYYPGTFKFLYNLYNLDIEPDLASDITAVDYLAYTFGFDVESVKNYRFKNENACLYNSEYIVRKELDYLKENDEVISVSIRNKLENVSYVECSKIDFYVEENILGKTENFEYIPEFIIYKRIEENGRIRQLVSLGFFDRILTTALALRLCRDLNHRWQSYSYRVSFLENNMLFVPWFSSWRRFIDELRIYLELPFMMNNYVLYIDLKHCYDSIDILVIYNSYKDKLSEEGKKIFEFLCNYNDSLMKKMNKDCRIGVPQGPAYARILTEIYLDEVLKSILKDNQSNYTLLRYVDDIVIFCDNEENADNIYKTMKDGLGKCGLKLNTEKSHNYGRISELTQKEKDELLHKNRFNYELIEKSASEVTFDFERTIRLKKYLRENPFDISLLGYIFSSYTFFETKEFCFKEYGRYIMQSRAGRGKYFRQFYYFLLSKSERIFHAVQNGWFQGIPVDSINFSNFISTLYFMIKDSSISEGDVRLIILSYLNDDFNVARLSTEDSIIVDAIKWKYR